jgi:S-adenosyl methyltransferase
MPFPLKVAMRAKIPPFPSSGESRRRAAATAVVRFFTGLERADPGVVPIHRWRPGAGPAGPPEVPAYGGVGRKP